MALSVDYRRGEKKQILIKRGECMYTDPLFIANVHDTLCRLFLFRMYLHCFLPLKFDICVYTVTSLLLQITQFYL